MFEQMRRKDREITEEESRNFLAQGEYGVLATVGEDGYPYGVPLSFAMVEGKICFHCAPDVGKKLKNIEHNQKVCFTVIGGVENQPSEFTTKYKSVIVYGIARKSDESMRRKVLEALIEKYSNDFLESGADYINRAISATGIIDIEIQHITGKASI